MSLAFTRAWEDDRLDAALLAVTPGARALVVAAAGDTALALAAAGADVVAVDLSPDQVALAALKSAALDALSPDELWRWFEVGREPAAPARYRAVLRERLDEPNRAYWDAHVGLFARGIHGAVGVGRPFARAGGLARVLVPGLRRAILETPDPATQADWWRRRARPILFGPLTHALARHTRVLAPLAPHPEELRRVREGGWTRGVAVRVDAIVATHLVREHPWWRPALTGTPVEPPHGARWLDHDALAALTASGRRPTFAVADLAVALSEQAPRSLAAISLSNVPDWLDEPANARLAVAAAAALASGGGLLVRRVVTPSGHDPFVRAGLVRDPVSDGLPAHDRTALYESVSLYRRDDQDQ